MDGAPCDRPCICPIINSLSNLSVPASSSNLPPLARRNLLDKPTNQFSQNGFVAERSVRHVHCRWLPDAAEVDEELISSTSRGGTETRAEVVLRMVRERVCHSMPEARDGKEVGRVERYISILWRASSADPAYLGEWLEQVKDGI